MALVEKGGEDFCVNTGWPLATMSAQSVNASTVLAGITM